jgi:lysophospholipase L1-like esterase
MWRFLKVLGVILGVEALLLGAGVLALWWHISHAGLPAYTDPNPTSDFKMIAMGDSYIAGEGAKQFYDGTDRRHVNECHRSDTAYPVLIATELHASLTFASCSGATTTDVLTRGQQPHQDPEVPGGEPQIEILRAHLDADVVLISIGGNDAGFGEIGKNCMLGGDCLGHADGWLLRLDSVVYPRLVEVFSKIETTISAASSSTHHTDVFALTYPDPLGSKHCLAPLLSGREQDFLANVFIPRLDILIRAAASEAGIRSIDLEHAFDGRRICDVSPGRAAANIVGLGNTRGTGFRIRQWGHDSLHPNATGHRMMEQLVRPVVEEARDGTLPPLPGPIGTPHRPGVAPDPGPYPFPQGTKCEGTQVKLVAYAAPLGQATTNISIENAKGGSSVCFHGNTGHWRSLMASPSGAFTVAVDTSHPAAGTGEVLYQPADGDWLLLVVASADVRAGGVDPLIKILAIVIPLLVLALDVIIALVWTRKHQVPS